MSRASWLPPVELLLAPYVDVERDRIVATLFEWLRIPSISAQPAHAPDVRRSAEFTVELMRKCGLEHVTVLETDGAPSVYGDHLHAGRDASTVLVYGHHDVQPVDPLDDWTSPPFEPVIVDGECRARGAIDDKGQVLYELEAVRGFLERDGRLPVNVKFVVEGEEEVGTPHFEALLQRERKRLACDVVVISDTEHVGGRSPLDVRRHARSGRVRRRAPQRGGRPPLGRVRRSGPQPGPPHRPTGRRRSTTRTDA